MTTRPDTWTLLGMTWLDRPNGNTYHSARAFRNGELVAVVPFQYGYGDQWDYSLAETLEDLGYLKVNPGTRLTYGARRQLEDTGATVITFCATGTRAEVTRFGTHPDEEDGPIH
jgi:hypothetical protein